MKIFRDLVEKRPFLGGCAVAIGNFDGVHLGHQAIIDQLLADAQRLGVPAVVLTFDPLPREFFQKIPPARLTRFREKLSYLATFGIAHVVCLRFNQALANQSADTFVKTVLCDQLQVKHLVVGDDFRFGHQRQGDFALLQTLGQSLGFSVAEAVTVSKAGARISSSRIRQALAAGDLTLAESLLGHPYQMLGRVVHGDKLGRTLGFPTVNIPVLRRQAPLQGVFAVKVHGLEKPYFGAANLGTRPAVGGQKPVLEVHIFDFNQSIYGKLLQIEFCHKLRDEADFESLEALTEQIAKDVKTAKEFFA